MPESFGARLRQQREQQHIALSSIAEQTKIGLSLLEGLERDDVVRWPTGIFRRSFIRAYAQAIGLEPDSIVREFLELHPEPVEDFAIALAAAQPGNGDGAAISRPRTRFRSLFDKAISSLPSRRPQQIAFGEPPAESSIGVFNIDSLMLARPPVPGPSADARRISDGVTESVAIPADSDSANVLAPLAQDQVPDEYPQPAVAMNETAAGDESSVPAPLPPEPDVTSAPCLNTDGVKDSREVDLSAAAHLCTELGRVLEPQDMAPLLGGAAKILNAVGLVVWIWDAQRTALRPALAHGYSSDVLAQLPRVRLDTDNATATAFRSAQTRIVSSDETASGAVVVPLMTPGGCTGVLAVELTDGRERSESVRALAMIFAAQLATLVGLEPLAEAVNA